MTTYPLNFHHKIGPHDTFIIFCYGLSLMVGLEIQHSLYRILTYRENEFRWTRRLLCLLGPFRLLNRKRLVRKKKKIYLHITHETYRCVQVRFILKLRFQILRSLACFGLYGKNNYKQKINKNKQILLLISIDFTMTISPFQP